MLWIWVRNVNLKQVNVLTHLTKKTVHAFLTETMETLMCFTLPVGLMPFQTNCPDNQWDMPHLPVDSGVLHKQ